VTTVGNVALYVSDLERSERFYVDVLGLEVTARVDTPDVREVLFGPLMLAQETAPSGPVVPGGIWKVFLFVDDAAAQHDRAVAAGAESVMAPTHLERFDITIAMVRDPDGYLLELGQRH
jgi:catechol 2,3-dioxygenase-like lactoylglutathione lyase family enzyme